MPAKWGLRPLLWKLSAPVRLRAGGEGDPQREDTGPQTCNMDQSCHGEPADLGV